MKKSITAKEIEQVFQELDLKSCILSDIKQNSYQNLSLTFYKKNVGPVILYVSFGPIVYLYQIDNKKPSLVKLQRFEQFTRANVCPCKVLDISCTKNEREVFIKVSHLEKELHLYLRLFSASMANFVICDKKDIIQEALYRRPKQDIVKDKVYKKAEGKEVDNFGIRERDYSFRTFSKQLENYYEQAPSKIESLLDYNKLLFSNEYNKTFNYLATTKEKINTQVANDENLIEQKELFLKNFDYTRENPSKVNILYNELKNIKQRYSINKNRLLKVEENFRNLENLKIQVLSSQDNAYIKSLISLLKKENENTLKEKGNYTSLYAKLKESDFIDIYIGRNARENDYILRNIARGNDVFLHLREDKGSYVIIRASKNKTLTKDALLDAAELCLFYSRKRKEGNIYKTQVKYVKRIKGAKLGLVEILRDENFFYRSSQKRLDEILSRIEC